MTQPVEDDNARRLLERCARKDERALAELHGLLARRIHAFASHRLRNEEDAVTVVIDTLHEVWKSAGRFRGDSRVSTWVLGIARFKTFAVLRAREPEMDDIDDHRETLSSEWLDGEAALDRWQQEQIVRTCLRGLSPAHRECIQLVYFEGMGLTEVANVQRVPENTVKTRLFHARKLMRGCVETVGGTRS
jgi:RNA polymerase sigma-70 factor, ECF subfamily